ncbi:MAG: hypothetical protein D5R96_02055, partial [Methanocalculus sp. MSAO_Arc2]
PTPVRTDDTYERKWSTSGIGLDAGSYTVYALTDPFNRNNLADANDYDSVSIVLRKPFVTATPSATTVAKGYDIYIHGIAKGEPTDGVAVWVFGRGYFGRWTTDVEYDGTFEFDDLDSAWTADRSAGEYFVVVQHPMENDEFDVVVRTVGGRTIVQDRDGMDEFVVEGPGSLQGAQAAQALIDLLNKPQIDDTYVRVSFLVEDPWIRFDRIGDRYVGDIFTITGTTNLGVDNELIVEVISSRFEPAPKEAPAEFAGVSATVKVVDGNADHNTWSIKVDTTPFSPDEYVVSVESIEAGVTSTTTFNVLEEGQPIPTPEPTPEQTPEPVPNGSGLGVENVEGIPTGELIPGTELEIYCTITDFIEGEGFTIRGTDTVEFYTDLHSARWHFTFIIGGRGIEWPPRSGGRVTITGYDLSYPDDYTIKLRVQLTGEVPYVITTSDKTILRVRQLDSGDRVRSGGEYLVTRTVQTPQPEPVDTIILQPGWNFISVPKRLAEGSNTAAIFADVDTDGRSIFQYNAASETWETMNPASPVKPLVAIWIYARETTSIALEFDLGAVQVPPLKQLYEGWNAIGFSSTIPATARDTLLSVSPKWTQVLGWNADTQSYDTAIIRGGSGAFSDTREMMPMQGYWIAMTEEGVLYALS